MTRCHHLAVVAVAMAAAAALATSSASAFAGNPCSLAAAKQVTPFGVAGHCKPRTLNGPGFTSSIATWGTTLSGTSTHLSISVNTFQSTSSPMWQIATKDLGKLPGAKKVTGIGSAAYESGADGGTLAIVNFVVGHTVCNINLRTAKPLHSLAALNALAKAVAAKL